MEVRESLASGELFVVEGVNYAVHSVGWGESFPAPHPTPGLPPSGLIQHSPSTPRY